MKALITGYRGFIGRNLTEALFRKREIDMLLFDVESDISLLEEYTKKCNFVYHLAAVHRPPDKSEFDKVNRGFLENVLMLLQENQNSCPVLLTSSIHAGPYTEYGKSKMAAEEALLKHSEKMNSKAIIYRLTNTFGRYALPNHHSVVANFCYNIANNLPVTINDPERVMQLYYIDDVIDSLLQHLDKKLEPDMDGFFRLPKSLTYSVTLQKLTEFIYSFKTWYEQNEAPLLNDEFEKKLHETFLNFVTDPKVRFYEK
jgi:UDP-2-acetamido-2,6-beta-L-arabino-hexul-4-ose reductase